MAAFARWSATGDAADARAVRDAEHEGDDLRHELLQALSTALTTPIEQEDAYALSERIDEVLDRAKDTVRVADAFQWRPDEHTAAMGASVEEATRHLNDAVGCLSGKGEHPGDHAELMIKAARTVEHGLLAAFAALPRDGTSWDRTAALEVYRGYSDDRARAPPGRRPDVVRGAPRDVSAPLPHRTRPPPDTMTRMASGPETAESANGGSMKTFHRETHFRTAGGLSVTDITDQVQEAVRESGVRDGVCCVYSPHTTCSVRVNEYERGLPRGLLRPAPPARARPSTTTPTTTGTAARRTSPRRTWRRRTATRTACRC